MNYCFLFDFGMDFDSYCKPFGGLPTLIRTHIHDTCATLPPGGWTLNLATWRLGFKPWVLGRGAFGFGWGLGSGFGYVDLASCGSWSLGLEAWGLDWGSDLVFGLGFALVDFVSWGVWLWTLDLSRLDLQKY